MLSFVRALATCFSARATILVLNWLAYCLISSWMSRCEYHTSRLFMSRTGASPCGRPESVEHDLVLVLGGEAAVARGDQHARSQALDIPLPRARQRLVEVVEVEHHPPFGGGKDAEVRQVRVPAALHRQARARRGAQIVSHDHGRAPIERERRHQHPPVADRNKFRHAGFALAFEQLDRIGATSVRARTRHARTAAPPTGRPCRVLLAPPPIDAQPQAAAARRCGRTAGCVPAPPILMLISSPSIRSSFGTVSYRTMLRASRPVLQVGRPLNDG